MQPAIAYLLKMGLCSAILYGYYWFALRNERFHHWNRFYLLAAMLLSVAVPFLNIPLLAGENPSVVVNMVAVLPWNNSLPVPAFEWSWKHTINTVAILISGALLLHLLASVIKVIRLYRVHPATRLNDVSLVLTEERSAPFSFFKWLFWRNDIDPDTENGQRMLQHELAHISQRHSADKLFTELLLVVFWMNPFFWIMRRELYAIHEFLADQKAIARHDGAAFAAMILLAAHNSTSPTLSNPFFSSQLKRRLIMITTSKAPRYSYLRRISGLVLMLVTTALLMLSIQQAQAQKKDMPPPPPPPPAKLISPNMPDSIKSIEMSEKNGVARVTYDMKDGRKVSYDVKEAKKRGLFLPPPPPPPPAAPNEIAPVAPAAPANGVAPLAVPAPPAPPAPADTEKTAMTTGDKPLYIYGGLKISEAQMKEIDPATIASVDVLKGESAIKPYGEAGRNGVVIITPKSGSNTSVSSARPTVNLYTVQSDHQTGSINTVHVTTNNEKSAPFYTINDEKASLAQVNAISPDNISSIHVLNGESATKAYGNDGKNGVVEVTLKPENTVEVVPDVVFTEAGTMPLFVGGADAWNYYLRQNMNYPLEARKAKWKADVKVQFTVKTDGTIANVKALNDPGYGLAQEAERLIKKSPPWNAAIQNGQKVAARVIQVIKFQPG